MGNAHHSGLVRRILWKVGLASGFANVDGAIFIFAFLRFLGPQEDVPGDRDVFGDVILFAIYLLIASAICGRGTYLILRRRLRWLDEGRRPSSREARATLRLPLAIAAWGLLTWVLAIPMFAGTAVWSEGHSTAFGLIIGAFIFEAGLISAGLSYLLVERACRPVFAQVLAVEQPVSRLRLGISLRLLLAWMLGSAVPLAALLVLPFAPGDERKGIGGAVVALAAYGLLVGMATTVAAARSVSDPLREVRTALKQVEAGRLDVTVTVNDSGDVGRLQAGVNQMVEGMRERQRLADLFGRHVGTEVAQRALEQGTGLDTEVREASVLFVDLIGSTAMAEVLPPHEVVATLNAFFGAVVRVVDREGGWVNKFEGDGAMCVFGAPAIQPDHAARALRAARRLHAELAEVGAAHPGLDAGIGVSSGQVVAGNVGTETRYEYTLLGAPVNEAARLCDLAKRREGRVLAAAVSVGMAGEEGPRWADVGTVALRGKAAPTPVREPATVVPAT